VFDAVENNLGNECDTNEVQLNVIKQLTLHKHAYIENTQKLRNLVIEYIIYGCSCVDF